MILTLWQFDPEFRIIEELSKLLPQTGLKYRGIPSEKILAPGHPLYSIASVSQNDSMRDKDSFFPKIGVEWAEDEPSEDLSGNYRIFPFDNQIKNKIKSYKQRKDSEYENLGFKQFDLILNSTAYRSVESYTSHVTSRIMLSGWGGSGSEGRKTAQELYKAILSCLPFLKNTIQKKYKASIVLDGKPALNIEAPTIGRGVWGFEMFFLVRQFKRDYCFTESELVSKADVYFHGTGTLPETENLGKSNGNMNFHPLTEKI